MPKEYSKEELWNLYKKLPEELKEAIFSEATADNIFNICTRNEIEDDRISEIARYVGRVLMGVLPPDEVQKTLEKELGLKIDLAKKVTQEISRFIFYPIKPVLEELYKIEIAPLTKPSVVPPTTKPLEGAPPIEVSPEEEIERTKEDIYRETIE